MKKTLLILFVLSIAFSSCKKEPSASFEFSMDGSLAPCLVSFVNNSTEASTYHWDFGDGSSSSATNPIHEFIEGGNYSVLLTATGEGGENITTQTVTIKHSVTGEWATKLTLENEIYDATFTFTQSENGELTGNFVFTDGSGYANLLSSSNVENNNINVDFMMGGLYLSELSGTISSDYKSMSGKYTIGSLSTKYDWTANKEEVKSSKVIDSKIKSLQKIISQINK